MVGCVQKGWDGKGCWLTGRDTLDTATTGETADGGLGYALDVVTENLSVALGSAFAETLSAFSACCGHASVCLVLLCFALLWGKETAVPWKAGGDGARRFTHVQSC